MSMFKLQPPIPSSHHLVQQEFDQLHYDLHRSRLENDRLGKIENENRRLLKALVDTAERRSSLSIPNDYEPKSLNQNRRLHSTIGMLRENEKIVNRLINVKPTHDREKLDQQWVEREKILRNISRYRHPWRRQIDQAKLQPEMDAGPSSMPMVRGTEIAKPAILMKRVVGHINTNRTRARSMDSHLSRLRLDKIPSQVAEAEEKETEHARETRQIEKDE